MLAQATWKEQTIIITFFVTAINAPISWKKAQLGRTITWCGWTFHLDIEALRLVAGKLAKLRDESEKLARSSSLKALWASSCGPPAPANTSGPAWRRYKDLRSDKGTLRQVNARDWQGVRKSLAPHAMFAHQPAGLWVTPGSRLLEVGPIAVQRKQDVPRIPPSHKPQWVRLADPMRSEIHLRNESRQALRWLSACFNHDQLRTLRQSPLLHCMAAADAMAEGDTVGIGGWIGAASNFFWFSEPTSHA